MMVFRTTTASTTRASTVSLRISASTEEASSTQMSGVFT
jgi:hypothetical protein